MKKILLLLLLFPALLLSETEQPPRKVKDPATMENFRQIYYDVDQIKATAGIGVTDGSNACAGCIGEYIESLPAGVDFPASGIYGDAASINLTAGDWDVSINSQIDFTGSVITGFSIVGISTISGNSGTNLVAGSNRCYLTPITNNVYPGIVPSYRISLMTTTTIYFKTYATYTNTTPVLYGRISARRIR